LAVKIRLFRMGRKKKPFYRIVVTDSRVRRDGSYIEKVGTYDPLPKPAVVDLDRARILGWLERGAEPTPTVFNLLQSQGIALEWHLVRNKVSEQTRHIELQKWELANRAQVPQAESSVEPTQEEKTPSEPEEAPAAPTEAE